MTGHLAERAVVALLVATGGACGADDNHASTLAAVLVGRHSGDVGDVVGFGFWCCCFSCGVSWKDCLDVEAGDEKKRNKSSSRRREREEYK